MNEEEKAAFKEEVVGYLHEARKFRPRKVTDWLDLGLKTLAILAAVVTGLTFVISAFFPQWVDAPDKIEANTAAIVETNNAIELLSASLALVRPQVVDFKGNLVPYPSLIEAGKSLTMSMVVRRNVSCDTLVRIRFFNHRTNTIQSRVTYEIRAVKSPVSATFTSFSLQLFIPDELPPGVYSYFPELIPIDCGVYEPVVSPMSLPFEVTAPS